MGLAKSVGRSIWRNLRRHSSDLYCVNMSVLVVFTGR